MRLRYRYLDLRREQMQRNLRLSATVVAAIRRFMDEQGFVDVWTPNLTKATPEGARDFLVPVRLQPGPLLRAAAVAADLQADPDGRRLRPLLPDRDLLPGRGSPRRPAVRVPPARPRAGVPDARGGLRRRSRAPSCASFEALGRDAARAAVPAADLARGDGALRLRQARPPLRPRDPRRDRGDARLGVQGLRAGAERPVPDRAAGALARRARVARGAGEGVGRRRGSRTSSSTRRARCARRSRSSSRPS